MSNEIKKKERERRFLDIALAKHGLSPGNPDDIEENKCAHGKPDFFMEVGGKRVGIEVTEVYSDGSSAKEIQSNRNRVLMQAKEICERNKIPPLWVNVTFAETKISKRDRDDLSCQLADRVMDHYLCAGPYGVNVHVSEVKWPALARFVEKFSIHLRPENCRHAWTSPITGWVNDRCPEDLLRCIEIKEQKLGEYLKKCDECWLLLVATWEAESSFIEWGEAFRNLVVPTGFSRIYFLDGSSGSSYQMNTERKLK